MYHVWCVQLRADVQLKPGAHSFKSDLETAVSWLTFL